MNEMVLNRVIRITLIKSLKVWQGLRNNSSLLSRVGHFMISTSQSVVARANRFPELFMHPLIYACGCDNWDHVALYIPRYLTKTI